MRDSRLVEILASFDKDDLKAFRKFLNSPFVKSRRNISQLFDVLSEYHPDYKSESISKDRIFRVLFEKEEFNAKKLENLALDLLSALESYLSHDALDSEKIDMMMYLSQGYFDRRLMNNSFRVLKKIESDSEFSFGKGHFYFSMLRKLSFMKSSYFMQNHQYEANIESVKEILEASAFQFILDLTHYQSIKRPALNTYGIEVKDDLLDSLIANFDFQLFVENLKSSQSMNALPVLMNYYKLKTIETPDEVEYYYKLRDVFYDSIETFDREHKHLNFSHLANYCVQNFLKNRNEFKKEGLEVYKKMMMNNAFTLSENEYIQTMTFRNIVLFCISNKDAEWLEYFLDNYSNALQPDEREDQKNYSYGQLYFLKGDFDGALDCVSRVRKEYFLFKTDLKNLLIKLYYELDHIESALSMVDSYRHFLNKNKEISENHKETFRNFLNYFYSLLKIKSLQSKEDPEFIKSQISSENRIISRHWLLEKADELISKK